MNIIEQLLEDHQKIRAVLNRMEQAVASDSDCSDLFKEFKTLFNQHDDAETDIIYPALQKYPELNKLILKGFQAHHLVEVGLLELRLLPFNAESWGPKFLVIRDSLLTHMEEEEQQVFAKARQLLSDEELNRMGNDVVKQRT